MSDLKSRENPDVTMLHTRSGNRGGNNAKSTMTRKIFLDAYEEHFGNVTAACRIAGISRQTYYRWMSSLSRPNVKFRQMLERIKPEERMLDLLEGAFVKRVLEGSDAMIKLGLERKGRLRGWSDPSKVNGDSPAIEKVANAYKTWLSGNPNASLKEKIRFLEMFAERANVPVPELAKQAGLVIR